jgi:hypothetical protein
VQVAAVNYVCPRGDSRVTKRFNDKFGDGWTHAVVFDGSSYSGRGTNIYNSDKLYTPGADAGMFIVCGTASLINRAGATSLFYHNDQFYFLLSYKELGISGKSSAPEMKIDGNKAKPLKLASPEQQKSIAASMEEFHAQQDKNEGSDS